MPSKRRLRSAGPWFVSTTHLYLYLHLLKVAGEFAQRA